MIFTSLLEKEKQRRTNSFNSFSLSRSRVSVPRVCLRTKIREMNAIAAAARCSLSLSLSASACSSSSSSSYAAQASTTTPMPIRRSLPRCSVSSLRSSPSSFPHLPPRPMPQRLGAYATGGVDKVRACKWEKKRVDQLENTKNETATSQGVTKETWDNERNINRPRPRPLLLPRLLLRRPPRRSGASTPLSPPWPPSGPLRQPTSLQPS